MICAIPIHQLFGRISSYVIYATDSPQISVKSPEDLRASAQNLHSSYKTHNRMKHLIGITSHISFFYLKGLRW